MSVVGFNFNKIFLERKEAIRDTVKINANINIINIKKQEMKIVPSKEALSVEFAFFAHYDTEKTQIAKLNLGGEVLWLVEPKEAKKILEEWKKKGPESIDEDTRVNLLNFILTKCNIKALALEDELGLPPHLPFPRFEKEEKKNN